MDPAAANRARRARVIRDREERVAQFKDKHLGEPCIVMANGPSLKACSPLMDRIECPVFGVNQSWTEYWPDYHFVQDSDHFRPPLSYKTQALADQGRLFVPPGRPMGIQLPRRIPPRRSEHFLEAFSFDATRVVYSWGGTVFVSMQVAATMGVVRIVLLGLDLQVKDKNNSHHYGRHHMNGYRYPQAFAHQCKAHRHAAPILDRHGIEVINCSMDSLCDAYPKMPFEEVIERGLVRSEAWLKRRSA